jgi:rod shape-determining protein MreB
LLGLFSVDMGIDLGTCNTLVTVRGQGIVLNEPSVVAVAKGTNKVLWNGNAVGWVAKEMLGKTPGTITAVRPLKDGVISDFDITEAMLGYFIRKVNGRSKIFGPRVVISVPSGITAVEKEAVYQSAQRAGARMTYLIKEPVAAAIGAGLPFVEPTASMIVDIGGGTTEVAVLSLGDIATCESVRIAGDDMDEAIMAHMKRAYNMMIGEQTAERIKIEIGSAAPVGPEPISAIVQAVSRTLERVEPELAADLVDNGITMAGGGSLLRGLTAVIQKATGLDTRLAEDPLTCVARGTATWLENMDKWKVTLENNFDG